ncbi:delta 8-sphingoloid desaturase protein [Mycena latifolia]|nr:delta 8-sphingoloid desaturase protein [Mycena latifolia]
MSATWSREAVATAILAGDHLVVYNDLLLRISPKWLDQHPGGALAILHFVGRDAADEIDSYHPDHVLDLVRRYKVGTVALPWKPLVPPVMSGWVRTSSNTWHNEASAVRAGSEILLVQKRTDDTDPAPTRDILEPPPSTLDPDVQARHSAAYKLLHKRVRDAGLYNTRYLTGYGPELVRYALLASLSAYAYAHAWFLTSALFLGLFWQQLTFVAHDLGHVGVTHNWTLDRILGIAIADWIGGLSIGWWVNNHNVHHLRLLSIFASIIDTARSDPDIEHLPFLAISPAFLDSLWSSYYKRTLHFDRFAHFFTFDTKRTRGGRWAWGLEVAGIVFFWCWFGRVLAGCGSWKTSLAYLLVSHIAAAPVHVQIVLSHFSMSTEDLGPTESFADRQLRTTTDVICPDSLGWIHGGLQLQVTHHLFPRLPRHNLKAASLLVKEFAAEQGLVYAEFGWISGNQDVLGVLKNVADQVKIIGTVAHVEAKEAVDRKLGLYEEKKA